MTDPILDQHRAYIGDSGSGKSTTARGHGGQLLRDRRHVVITDHTGVWYGLRVSADGAGPGFDIPIFGGRRGDVPISVNDGAAIGKIVGDGVSAIVDLSSLRTGADQRIFMRDFVAALRAKPPGHFQFIADEADEDVPERIRDDVGFALAEDMIWIAKRGRSDGFVLSLITQRPADIAKSALNQARTIFAHNLIAPSDQAAFGRYIKAKGTKAEYAEIMAKLPTLQTGERYVYNPTGHLLELGRSALPSTFDSSRAPGPGEARREPKMLAHVDMAAIAAALEKPQAAAAGAAYDAGLAAGEMLIEKDRRIAEIEQLLEKEKAVSAGLSHRLFGALRAISDAARDLLEASDRLAPSAAGGEVRGKKASLIAIDEYFADAEATSTEPARTHQPKASGDTFAFRGRKALVVLARIYPAGLSEAQWSTIAGYSRSGGTWGTYKSNLRAAGLIEERGGLWFATVDGVHQSGEVPTPLPAPGPDLARFWGQKISGTRKMVDALVARWPDMVTREALAADLGMSASGGTFGTYLGRLRSNGLLEERKNRVRLTAAVMGKA